MTDAAETMLALAASLLIMTLALHLFRRERLGRTIHPNGRDLTFPAAVYHGHQVLRRAARERRHARGLARQRERLTLRDVRHQHRGWDD